MSKTTHVVFLTAALALSVGNAAAIPYTFTSIVDTSGPLDPSFGFVSLNNSGTVAFVGSLDTGEYGIFTGNGGPTTTIADTSGPFGFFGFGRSPSLNNSGTVAFYAFANTTSLPGIFTGNGGPTTTIADFRTGPFFDYRFPSLNDSGTVAFAAVAGSDEHGAFTGGEGIFTGNGGPITTIADRSGPFDDFLAGGEPSLNNSGTVAFSATLDTGQTGIFTGPDPLADEVISTRDPLFGARVISLLMSRDSLNDTGQIAFFYQLDDGRFGIARADPLVTPAPEPGTLFLLVAGLLGAVWRRKGGST